MGRRLIQEQQVGGVGTDRSRVSGVSQQTEEPPTVQRAMTEVILEWTVRDQSADSRNFSSLLDPYLGSPMGACSSLNKH